VYADREHCDTNLCKRVLVVDEELTGRIQRAPEDPLSPVKHLLLAYKAELDDLIRLARLVVEQRE
jgi:hypothetical protein